MKRYLAALRMGFCLAGVVALGGCNQRAPQVAPAEPPAVPVSKALQREVTDFVDFTGRTDAVDAVDVRARVTGYLVKVAFKEGSDVKAGDQLFEIDPRPYQAQLDQAQAQVKLYQAQLELARTTLARDRAIVASGGAGAVSQQQIDQDVAAVAEAEARIKAYQAAVEVYQLNLNFTRVTSSISGQTSRFYLTPGNLVNQDQTLLTTVVSLDPIYAYFDMDEPTLLRIKRAINEGRIKRPQEGSKIPVLMGLQGEDGFPHDGSVNFVNNQVNPTTGSISVRGVFPNPRPDNGTRLLAPGMFVRIRLPIGQAHPATLVIDRAIGFDQGLKFVYVLGGENKIEYRRVKTGALQEDGLRVITEGLDPGETIVVGGLQQVRPRMTIRPDEVSMPTMGPGEPAPGQGDDAQRQGDKEKGRQGDREKGKEADKGKQE